MTSNSILNSILEINLYILIFSTLWIVIKSRISFISQRILLLSIPLIGVLVWAIKPLLMAKEMVYTSTVLTPVNILPKVSNLTENATSVLTGSGMYGGVTGGLVLYFLFKIANVLWFFKDAKKRGDISLKTSSMEDSFSFFKFIHLRAGMDEAEKKVVLQHELIHYQKRHSFDLVVMEVLHSLFWINPLFFYLKKELVNIHEFEVDQEMYKAHKSNYMRHLLNYALGSVDSHYLLTSPFYNRLTITKRIKMMKTSNKSNYILLFTIPIFALFLTVTSCEKKSEITNIPPPPPTVTNNPPPPPIPSEYLQEGELSKTPVFSGGKNALNTYLATNITYSKAAQEEGLSGRVFINFTVKKDGSIAFVTLQKGITKELDQEALRVIKNMPNWTPAEIDGRQVACQMTLPITFQLTSNNDQESPAISKETIEKKHAPINSKLDLDKLLKTQKEQGVEHDVSKLSSKPEFKGGLEEMYTFIGENMNYPEYAITHKIEGRVYVNFIVTAAGEIKDATVLRKVNDALDSEALRVINSMPNWNPAEIDNIPVSVAFTLPIVFKLD